MLFEPQHRLGIEVVGRLVEQQQIGFGEQQLTQGHAAALAPGEVSDRLVTRGAPQSVHGLLQLGIKIPCVGGINVRLQTAHLLHQGIEVGIGIRHLITDLVVALHLFENRAHAFLDVAQHGLLFVERRLLLQDAHRVTRRETGLPVGWLVESGHDLQDRRFPGSVGAEDSNFRARVEGHRDIIEDDFVAHLLAGLDHGVDEFSHDHQASRLGPVLLKPAQAAERGPRRPPDDPEAHRAKEPTAAAKPAAPNPPARSPSSDPHASRR